MKSFTRQPLTGTFYNATSGDTLRLDSTRTEFTVLEFWSTSCGPCIKEIPALNEFAEKYWGRVTFLSINSDLQYGRTVRELQTFIREHGITYPVLLDSESEQLMKRYQVGGWPARFLLDRSGYLYRDPFERRMKLSLNEIRRFLERE